jgi:predicted signal transduction protein with EAL and GGDEF domain
VARLGGDEFAIVQTASASADVADLVERIYEAIRSPINARPSGHDRRQHRHRAGAAGRRRSRPDLKNADLAMYAAKAAGRRTYRFFEPEMDAQVRARAAWRWICARRSPTAASRSHYQPCSLADNEITGCEALLRWRHPSAA